MTKKGLWRTLLGNKGVRVLPSKSFARSPNDSGMFADKRGFAAREVIGSDAGGAEDLLVEWETLRVSLVLESIVEALLDFGLLADVVDDPHSQAFGDGDLHSHLKFGD